MSVNGLAYRDAVRAPQGLYECSAHRWIALSVGNDREWAGLCQVIGHGEIAGDARYAGNLSRQRLHDEIDAVISGWAEGADADHAVAMLQARGVPAEVVASST